MADLRPLEVEGCGKQDAPLTLYHIPVQGEPMPLGDGYIRLRCGHVAQHEASSYGVLPDCRWPSPLIESVAHGLTI